MNESEFLCVFFLVIYLFCYYYFQDYFISFIFFSYSYNIVGGEYTDTQQVRGGAPSSIHDIVPPFTLVFSM